MARIPIGKIPISKGEYVEGMTCQKLWQVTDRGSTFQSRVDNNTTRPTAIDSDGRVIKVHTDLWLCIADATEAVNATEDMAKVKREWADEKADIDVKQDALAQQSSEAVKANEDATAKAQKATEDINAAIQAGAASGSAVGVAEAVTYDNSKSGLEGNNLQKVVDEAYKKSNYNDGDNVVDFSSLNFIVDNPRFVLIVTDKDGHVLVAYRKSDGKAVYGGGIPTQVKEYIDENIHKIWGEGNSTDSVDTLSKIIDFLKGFSNGDKLKELLEDNYKKSNPNDEEGNVTDTRDILHLASNNKFVLMLIDSLGKVFDAVGKDGIRKIFTDLNIKGALHLVNDNKRFLFMLVDSEDKFIFGIDRKTGTPVYGYGVPKQIKDFVNEVKENITKESLEAVESLIDEYFKITYSKGNIIFADIDDKVLFAIGLKNENKSFLPFNIQDASIKVEENPFCKLIVTDKEDKPFLWVRNDLSVDFVNGCPQPVKKFVEKFISDKIKEIDIPDYNGVVERNKDRLPALYAACRMSFSKKDFQLEIVTDTHSNYKALQNAVNIANGFDCIDAIIHDGDIVSTAGGLEHDYAVARMQDLAKSKKPWFITIGNHEVGQPYNIKASLTHKSIYNIFIKPMIDSGQLEEGEYAEGQIYYYHDFADVKFNKKIRLISLYEFDNPLDVDDTNPYWEKVEYNESYPQIEQKQYVYDENNPIYVNCGDFTGYSFKLKQTVTVSFYDSGNGYSPEYRIDRYISLIGEEQINWFIKTLLETPEDYGIIIAAHYPISGKNQKSSNFASNHYESGGGLPTIITDITNAYNNKAVLDKNVVCNGKAEYLNTLTDGNNNKYWYNVKADFTNAKAKILGFIGGHVHYDLLLKDKNGLYGIYPTSGVIDQWSIEDTARTMNDDLAFDAITVTSWAESRIALTRIGNLYSTDGKKMDLEIINIKE